MKKIYKDIKIKNKYTNFSLTLSLIQTLSDACAADKNSENIATKGNEPFLLSPTMFSTFLNN